MHPDMDGVDCECEMSGGEEEDARSPSSCSLSSHKGSQPADESVMNGNTVNESLSPKQDKLNATGETMFNDQQLSVAKC